MLLAASLAMACVAEQPLDVDEDLEADAEVEVQVVERTVPDQDAEVAPPATELPLTLMAALVAPSALESRAVIRDDGSGAIRSFHVGETVRDGVVLASVERDWVELDHDGHEETLAMGAAVVELGDHDRFYPDLSEDGEVDPLTGAIQLGSGPGYMVKRPHHAWGTENMVRTIREGVRLYQARMPGGPEIHIGDISKRGGGPFPPHLSHQSGRDVDIGYVLRGPLEHRTRFHDASSANLDVARTWALVEAILEAGDVHYVFMDYGIQRLLFEHAEAGGADEDTLDWVFQYPRGRNAARGVIRDWKGHRDHFHVRIYP